jgi:hypothetical protein
MCLIEFLAFGIAFIVVFLDLLAREDQGARLSERASQIRPSTRYDRLLDVR